MVGREKEKEVVMRVFLLILFFVLSSSYLTYGQACMTFQEIEEHNLDLEELDS